MKKRVLKSNWVYDNFELSLNYLKKNSIYFVVAFFLMLVAFLFGYFGIIGVFSSSLEKNLNDHISDSIKKIVLETEGLSPFELVGFIISNNMKTGFFGMVAGIFLGVASVLILVFNGYMLGFVAEMIVNSSLNNYGVLVLWKLFPHGIFEIPAILISIGLGIKIGLYPFYVKKKGFFSLTVSFLVFLFLSNVFFIIFNLFYPDVSLSSVIDKDKDFFSENSVAFFVFYFLEIVNFVTGFFIGLMVLSKKDRVMVREVFKNSLKVFVFVVIPLLVIAGIIEVALIVLFSS